MSALQRTKFSFVSLPRVCLSPVTEVSWPLMHTIFSLSMHIYQHQRVIHLPDWKMGSEESLTFTLCWIVLTWHLTCWLMRNIMACRKSKVKDEWASCWSSRHISGPKLFINILFGPAPIHPYLWYTSRIGSVISSIYLHLSHGSLVYVVCVCACACICVFQSLSVYMSVVEIIINSLEVIL